MLLRQQFLDLRAELAAQLQLQRQHLAALFEMRLRLSGHHARPDAVAHRSRILLAAGPCLRPSRWSGGPDARQGLDALLHLAQLFIRHVREVAEPHRLGDELGADAAALGLQQQRGALVAQVRTGLQQRQLALHQRIGEVEQAAVGVEQQGGGFAVEQRQALQPQQQGRLPCVPVGGAVAGRGGVEQQAQFVAQRLPFGAQFGLLGGGDASVQCGDGGAQLGARGFQGLGGIGAPGQQAVHLALMIQQRGRHSHNLLLHLQAVELALHPSAFVPEVEEDPHGRQ
ncbi:MAG: hypothetical protein JM57_05600 [Comamonadaceae bacterium BICA1-1]|nr:MAG: hypothetical protein JM57_05600 [Comamonadaceae bacterium BICA1-1]